jgi:hypothetical protein
MERAFNQRCHGFGSRWIIRRPYNSIVVVDKNCLRLISAAALGSDRMLPDLKALSASGLTDNTQRD